MLMCLLGSAIATATAVGVGFQAEGNAGNDVATDRVMTTGQLAGTLGLETMVERIALRAAYSPTLRFSETTGSAGALFNAFTASAGTRLRRWSIVATGSGTLGQQDFSPLTRPVAAVDPAAGATAPPSIDRLPPVRYISVASASAQIALDYTASTRTHWGATAGAATSGGWGDEASKLLPRQRTVTVGFNSRWQADHLDSLTGSLTSAFSTATLDDVSTGLSSRERTASLAAEVAWAHRFAPTTLGAVGVGVAGTSNSGGQGGEQVLIVPTASGSLFHSVPLRGQTLSFSAQITMQPQRDSLTGQAYVQGAATGSMTYSPVQWLTMATAASGARVVGGAFDGEWGAVGEVSAGFLVNRQTQLRIGFREAATPKRESVAVSTSAHVLQWSAFTGISTGFREAF